MRDAKVEKRRELSKGEF